MQMAKTSCKCKQVRGQKNRNALPRTDAASCKCNNSEATSQVGSTECQACYSHRYSPCIHSTNHYTFAIFTFVLRCLFTSFLFLFFVFVYMFLFTSHHCAHCNNNSPSFALCLYIFFTCISIRVSILVSVSHCAPHATLQPFETRL